jgi:hypothetical protein
MNGVGRKLLKVRMEWFSCMKKRNINGTTWFFEATGYNSDAMC